ncbi:hypothetical protein JXQ70_19790 [bacterium]|nr:hypothetical protein [bacterium]
MIKPTHCLYWIGLIVVVLAFVSITGQYFPNHPLAGLMFWQGHLSPELLDRSLELGTQFLVHNQKDAGNFNYEYDWTSKVFSREDNQVRQAGALWGIALIQRTKPSRQLERAFQQGIDFFRTNTRRGPDGRSWVVYPTENSGKTGTIALVCLAMIDFLRSNSELEREWLDTLTWDLGQYLEFLVSLRRNDGLLYGYYDHGTGRGFGEPSPYSDGEALLAMIKAQRYLGFTDLHGLIDQSAETMHRVYVRQALEKDPDSPVTKGFYQWGSMAFFELTTADRTNADHYGQVVIELADWIIDVHKILRRTRNTAYAYEGIIHAYRLAQLRHDQKHLEKFRAVIDRGLYTLTTWQVGSPVANRFLKKHTTTDKHALGGVMNHRSEPQLRIDVTQHQMHAVILARHYVFSDQEFAPSIPG